MERSAETQRLIALARHYLQISRPDRALEVLEQSQFVDHSSETVWFLRGKALYDLKDFTRALDAANFGLKQAPESRQLLALLGDIEVKRDDWAAAERAYLSALRQSPRDPNLLCAYAHLAARAGRMDRAENLVAQATQVSPRHVQVLQAQIAMAYLRRDSREAERLGRELLAIDPDNVYGRRMLAVSLQSSGQYTNALRHLQAALRMDPTSRRTANAVRQTTLLSQWPLRPLQWFMVGKASRLFLMVFLILIVFYSAARTTIGFVVMMVLGAYIIVVPALVSWWVGRRKS